MKYLQLSKNVAIAALSLVTTTSFAKENDPPAKKPADEIKNAGLTLPKGFSAESVVDSMGAVRHIVVDQSGILYAKLERRRVASGWTGVRALQLNGNTKATELPGFGDYTGTGILIKNNYLYTSSNSEVFRYKLVNGKVQNPSQPEVIVTGLIDKRQHASKSIAIDDADNLYVNIGAPSNVCQEKDRVKGSPGMMPCPILDSAGGIWKFSASKQKQSYAEGKRYATGLRNVVGLDWNSKENALYVTVHGRDMLFQHFPEMFDQKLGAELPAETMYKLKEGDHAGWPYAFWDQGQKKYILSPEYGGDGKKEPTQKFTPPVMDFPGHLAPNALLFYTGNMFPERYKNGAFIAFRGSWNRAPEPQSGYFIVFVPFEKGKPTGKWEIFAEGFKGKELIINPNDALYRPCGLAQGPDGSLYISEDNKGKIWRVTYSGQ